MSYTIFNKIFPSWIMFYLVSKKKKKINTAGACIALWLKRRKLMASLNWDIWVCRSLNECESRNFNLLVLLGQTHENEWDCTKTTRMMFVCFFSLWMIAKQALSQDFAISFLTKMKIFQFWLFGTNPSKTWHNHWQKILHKKAYLIKFNILLF